MSEPTLPWPPEARELRLGDLIVDLRYRRVVLHGTATELPQRPFDLLCLLIAEPYLLHSRNELFQRVWKGAVVEDANLSQSVWLVRNALGEPAKTWLRTVAKGGYVFEPPMPVEVVSERTVPAPSATAAVGRSGPRVRPLLLAAAFALAAAVLVVKVIVPRFAHTEVGPARVVLLDAEGDKSTAATPRHWASALMRAWLEWKLSREPGVVVVDAPRLADGDEGSSGQVHIVLLSAVAQPGDAATVRLRAHLAGVEPQRDFAVTAPLADVAARVDTLARDIVAALVARPVAHDEPPLALDAEAAQHYVEALALRDARRPADAVRAFDRVLQSAPRFALARVQQAELLGDLGRLGAAREQLALAADWIARLPPVAADIVTAQRLMIQRDYAEAVAAYEKLTQRYPVQPTYAIRFARALLAAGRADDALRALTPIDWSLQPTALRVDALLARGEAEVGSNALERAVQDAERADAIAASAGWSRQRGLAQFLAARAAMLAGRAGVDDRFERAANQFDAAGDRLGALRVRMYGETRRRESDGERLRSLLEEARAAGNIELEVFGLRAESLRRAYRGEFAQTRELIARATAVAETSGDPRDLSVLRFEALQADVYLADYAAAERRLEALGEAPLQGLVRIAVGKLAVALAVRQGRYDAAAAALAHYRTQPGDEAEFGAVEVELLLRRVDLAAARLAAERCAASETETTALTCSVQLAIVARLGGDPAAALAQLDAIRARLEALRDDTNRWELESLYARERSRAGDPVGAEPMLVALRERLRTRDMPGVYVETLLSSAETALRLDRVDEAAQWLADARMRMPAGDWLARVRAETVDAIVRHRRGDADAFAGLAVLADEARTRGDALAELFALTIPAQARGVDLPPRAIELAARSGIRGVSARAELQSRPTGAR